MIVLDYYITLITCCYLFNAIRSKQIKVFQFSVIFYRNMCEKSYSE
jgi:hypothetical protein